MYEKDRLKRFRSHYRTFKGVVYIQGNDTKKELNYHYPETSAKIEALKISQNIKKKFKMFIYLLEI